MVDQNFEAVAGGAGSSAVLVDIAEKRIDLAEAGKFDFELKERTPDWRAVAEWCY